jgi:hypothetical protein
VLFYKKEKIGNTQAVLLNASFVCLISSLLYMSLTRWGSGIGFLISFLLYSSAKIIK